MLVVKDLSRLGRESKIEILNSTHLQPQRPTDRTVAVAVCFALWADMAEHGSKWGGSHNTHQMRKVYFARFTASYGINRIVVT